MYSFFWALCNNMQTGSQDACASFFAAATLKTNQPTCLLSTEIVFDSAHTHSHVLLFPPFTNIQDIHESDRVVAAQTFVVPPDDEALFHDAVAQTAAVSSTLKAEQVRLLKPAAYLSFSSFLQTNGKIPCVQLGNWDLHPWHASPYPQV